jgi:hypothetical protein
MALDKSDVQNLLDEFVVNNKTEILDVEKDNPELHSAVINALAFLSTRFGTQKGIELPTKPTVIPSVNYQNQKSINTSSQNSLRLLRGNVFLNRSLDTSLYNTFSLIFEDYKVVDGIEYLRFYDDYFNIVSFTNAKILKYINNGNIEYIPSTFGYDEMLVKGKYQVRLIFRTNQQVSYEGKIYDIISIEDDLSNIEIKIKIIDWVTGAITVVPYSEAIYKFGVSDVKISTSVPYADDFVDGQFLIDNRKYGFEYLIFDGDKIGNIPIFKPWVGGAGGILLQNNYIFWLLLMGLITIEPDAIFISEGGTYTILKVGDIIMNNRGEEHMIHKIYIESSQGKVFRKVEIFNIMLGTRSMTDIRQSDIIDLFKYHGWTKVSSVPTPAPITSSSTSAPKKSAPKKSTTTKVAKVPNKDREIKRIQKLIDGLQILADLGDDESIKQIAEFQKEIDALSKN